MTSPTGQQIHKLWIPTLLITLAFLVFSLPGCSSRSHVRHLASDAILIVPQQSTSKEVISLLGQPDQRREMKTGEKEWIYFQSKQSMLRKTPYVGENLGHTDYDVIVVQFTNDLVSSSTYRLLTETEFKAAGIKSNYQLNEK